MSNSELNIQGALVMDINSDEEPQVSNNLEIMDIEMNNIENEAMSEDETTPNIEELFELQKESLSYANRQIDGIAEKQMSDELDTVIEMNDQSNLYAAKKTVAQGMMDIALITANANQLRYMLEYNRNSSTFYLNVTLISISLILQVAVGVSLIFRGRFDMKGEAKEEQANRINNYVVVGIFLITLINVFIASFTITGNNTSTNGSLK